MPLRYVDLVTLDAEPKEFSLGFDLDLTTN